ncbi:MAG: cell division protein FtsA [Bacilli bacterium]|nr:cell division protein FtsA [Bacilli bacterium]
MKYVYTSVDIGSDTIKVVVCELFNNKLNLLAASSVKSNGIKKGLITNGKEASISLKKAISEVEDMLGIKIKNVIATIPNYFSEFVMVKAEQHFEEETEITGEEIVSLLQLAMKSKKIENRVMVTTIPIDFMVNREEGIKDPKGMLAHDFATRAVMVLTPKKNIMSVVTLLEDAGLEVADVSLSSIGDMASMKEDITKSGVGAVINIGHETTTVSLFNKGIIVNNSVLGVGGKNIDNDISYMYKVTPKESKKIKEKFALAHKKYASKSDYIEVLNKDGENIKISQYEVSEVVMARLEEILILARKEINTLTKRDIDYILITGGTSSMTNFSLIAEEILGNKAKVSDIHLVGLRNNKYSASVGNIAYYISKMKLKGKIHSMLSKSDMEEISSEKDGIFTVSEESMLGKVFGYFFSE